MTGNYTIACACGKNHGIVVTPTGVFVEVPKAAPPEALQTIAVSTAIKAALTRPAGVKIGKRTVAKFVCKKCSKVCKSPAGRGIHEKHCEG